MRNPRVAVRRLPALRKTGKIISDIIDAYIIEHPRLVADCLRALKDDKFLGPSQLLIDGLKRKSIDVIGWAPDFPSAVLGVKTEVDALFIEAWRHHAQDPDVEIARWLVLGAPAGIDSHSKGAELGVFPPPCDRYKDAHDLTYYADGWKN